MRVRYHRRLLVAASGLLLILVSLVNGATVSAGSNPAVEWSEHIQAPSGNVGLGISGNGMSVLNTECWYPSNYDPLTHPGLTEAAGANEIGVEDSGLGATEALTKGTKMSCYNFEGHNAPTTILYYDTKTSTQLHTQKVEEVEEGQEFSSSKSSSIKLVLGPFSLGHSKSSSEASSKKKTVTVTRDTTEHTMDRFAISSNPKVQLVCEKVDGLKQPVCVERSTPQDLSPEFRQRTGSLCATEGMVQALKHLLQEQQEAAGSQGKATSQATTTTTASDKKSKGTSLLQAEAEQRHGLRRSGRRHNRRRSRRGSTGHHLESWRRPAPNGQPDKSTTPANAMNSMLAASPARAAFRKAIQESGCLPQYVQFLQAFGLEYSSMNILGTTATVTRTSKHSEESEAAANSKSSETSFSVAPPEAEDPKVRIDEQTETTDEGEGASTVVHTYRKVTPPPPSDKGEDSDEKPGAMSEAAKGAMKMAVTAMVPVAAPLVNGPGGDKVFDTVLEAVKMLGVSLEVSVSSTKTQMSQSAKTNAETVIGMELEGGDVAQVEVVMTGDGGLAVVGEQLNDIFTAQAVLQQENKAIEGLVGIGTECTAANSPKHRAARPQLPEFKPAGGDGAVDRETARIVGGLGYLVDNSALSKSGKVVDAAGLTGAAKAFAKTSSGFDAEPDWKEQLPSLVAPGALRQGLDLTGYLLQQAMGQDKSGVVSFASLRSLLMSALAVASQSDGKGCAALGISDRAREILGNRELLCCGSACDHKDEHYDMSVVVRLQDATGFGEDAELAGHIELHHLTGYGDYHNNGGPGDGVHLAGHLELHNLQGNGAISDLVGHMELHDFAGHAKHRYLVGHVVLKDSSGNADTEYQGHVELHYLERQGRMHNLKGTIELRDTLPDGKNARARGRTGSGHDLQGSIEMNDLIGHAEINDLAAHVEQGMETLGNKVTVAAQQTGHLPLPTSSVVIATVPCASGIDGKDRPVMLQYSPLEKQYLVIDPLAPGRRAQPMYVAFTGCNSTFDAPAQLIAPIAKDGAGAGTVGSHYAATMRAAGSVLDGALVHGKTRSVFQDVEATAAAIAEGNPCDELPEHVRDAILAAGRLGMLGSKVATAATQALVGCSPGSGASPSQVSGGSGTLDGAGVAKSESGSFMKKGQGNGGNPTMKRSVLLQSQADTSRRHLRRSSARSLAAARAAAGGAVAAAYKVVAGLATGSMQDGTMDGAASGLRTLPFVREGLAADAGKAASPDAMEELPNMCLDGGIFVGATRREALHVVAETMADQAVDLQDKVTALQELRARLEDGETLEEEDCAVADDAVAYINKNVDSVMGVRGVNMEVPLACNQLRDIQELQAAGRVRYLPGVSAQGQSRDLYQAASPLLAQYATKYGTQMPSVRPWPKRDAVVDRDAYIATGTPANQGSDIAQALKTGAMPTQKY